MLRRSDDCMIEDGLASLDLTNDRRHLDDFGPGSENRDNLSAHLPLLACRRGAAHCVVAPWRLSKNQPRFPMRRPIWTLPLLPLHRLFPYSTADPLRPSPVQGLQKGDRNPSPDPPEPSSNRQEAH